VKLKTKVSSGVFCRGRFVIDLIGDSGGDLASVTLRTRLEGAILALVKVWWLW
jgi:hypothetical protein